MHSRTKVRTHSRRINGKRIQVRQHSRDLHQPFSTMPENTFHLPIETATFVPRTNAQQEEISATEFDKRIKETEKELSENFGGFTEVKAKGGFTLDNGKLVKEDVAKVTSFSTKDKYLKNRDKYAKWLAKKGKEWGQESMGVEYEGDLYYV